MPPLVIEQVEAIGANPCCQLTLRDGERLQYVMFHDILLQRILNYGLPVDLAIAKPADVLGK